MVDTAIVAIPKKDDYVWQISSEKVPHLTILNLGDQSANPNISKIVQYVQHAVNTSLSRFGLDVDRRDTLGLDEADVLFFKTKREKQVEQFRSYLLQDDNIKKAFDSVSQFPEWTPHLTLGFPESPAKPDKRDYPGTQWVSFDKISVWTGDFDGPEFDLKDRWEMTEDVSMSALIDGILAKHGNDIVEHVSEKPWSDYKESDYSLEQWHNACLIHQHTGPLTNKNDDKLPVKTPSGVLNKNGVVAAAAALAGARGGVSASPAEKLSAAKALIRYYGQLDKKPSPKLLAMVKHYDVSDFLSHFGVKGQKWGVRRSTSELSGGHSVSDDVKRVREATAKISRGNTTALSNKELQDVVTRMNLDQQFSRLSSQTSTVKKGATFVKAAISIGKTVNEVMKFANSPAGQAVKLAMK